MIRGWKRIDKLIARTLGRSRRWAQMNASRPEDPLPIVRSARGVTLDSRDLSAWIVRQQARGRAYVEATVRGKKKRRGSPGRWPIGYPSLGEVGALWLRDHPDETLASAADKFQVTRQCVQLGWHKLKLGETPFQARQRAQREAIVAMLRKKIDIAKISAAVGVDDRSIRDLARRSKLSVHDQVREDVATAIAAGIAVVRAGGTYAEGASVAGIQEVNFAERCKRAGVRSKNRGGRQNGLSARAVALADREGISDSEAAKLLGTPAAGVHAYRRRLLKRPT